MKIKRRGLTTGVLLVLSLAVMYLSQQSAFVALYSQYLFDCLQGGRGQLLNWLPVSLGDILYLLIGAFVVVAVVSAIRQLFRLPNSAARILFSFLGAANFLLAVYLWFMLGWGINYGKQKLAVSWQLVSEANEDTRGRKSVDSLRLIWLSEMLIVRLNSTALTANWYGLDSANLIASRLYDACTDSKVAGRVRIKHTLFSYFLDRMGIEGYYNPFTGEGQISKSLPAFMLPFVICHEMAHQAGIAAEGDANLLAYVVTTASNDSAFRYSGYLNLWLYAGRKLYRRDSGVAKTLYYRLNSRTRAHLDTLEQLSRLYDNEVARYGSDVYDDYLKLQHQKEGMRSYGNMVATAWIVEQARMQGKLSYVHIP